MDNISNINNKKKEIFPMIISDNSAMRNFRKKEDSRKSSGISLSDNYSLSSSSKGIKHYNFNKTQSKTKVKFNSKNLFLSSIDFPAKKRKENLKNKLITQTKYLSIFNSNKKNFNNNKRTSNFFKENNLNNINIFSKQSKKLKFISKTPGQKNINETSILQKFNKDIKNYFLNCLENSKNDIKKNLAKLKKLNKTHYPTEKPQSKSPPKIFLTRHNSALSQRSQKSFSSKSNNKSREFKENNNIENKIFRTKYSSQLIKINKNYKRRRNLRQYIDEKKFMDKDWNSKIGIAKSNIEYNPFISNDVKFQSGLIKDELCLLLDDIQYFRITLSSKNDLFSSFKNMTIQKQVQTNKLLEESCALLHYIPKIILKEYYFSTDKFISIEDPSREMFAKKVVYNESETFQDNLKYIYKISNYIKCCGEVYFQLIIQVEGEMAISSQNFIILHKILKRVRFLIINLTNICKNILINYCFDKYVIINKFKKVIKQNKAYIKRIMTETQEPKVIQKKFKIKKKPRIKITLNDISKKGKRRETDINKYIPEQEKNLEEYKNKEKMKNITKTFGDKKNVLIDKMSRISKALELNIYNKEEINKKREIEKNENIKPITCINKRHKDKKLKYIDKDVREKRTRISKAEELKIDNKEEIKKERVLEKNENINPMACINSRLMAKMLHYIDKDVREKIISLRTCERHLNYKNDDDE